MKRRYLMILALVAVMGILVPAVSAATPEDIEASVKQGLTWLASQQSDADGSWGSYCRVAQTGLAVLKFEDRAYELGFASPLDPNYEYRQEVEDGLAYLVSKVNDDGTITDPDTCGGEITYETSIATMALSRSGRADGDDTIVRNAVAWLIKTQNPDGAWRYPSPNSDQSNSGWASLALVYAQNNYHVDISETMQNGDGKDLHDWVDFIQCTDGGIDDGSAGYTWPCYWPNILKTGNLLYQFAMLGRSVDDPDVDTAIRYIERHWAAADWCGEGWLYHYQAMYAMMKGFEAYDIKLIDTDGDGARDDDWFAEVSDHIIATQIQPAGNWPSDCWGHQTLPTSWALLTLEKFVEKPAKIAIVKRAEPETVYVGQKVTYTYTVTNVGDVDLTDIAVTDDQPGVIPAYVSGDTDNDKELDLTETWIFQATAIPAVAGPLTNTGTAKAKAGDQETTASATATIEVLPKIWVSIDIKPGSCPNPVTLRDTGVIPVSVLGKADFDVKKIDPASIRLTREGVPGAVPPIRWTFADTATPFTGKLCGCHPLTADGFTDLDLKFDVKRVINDLKLNLVTGKTIPLTVTGALKPEYGGTPIEGSDCMRVLLK